MKGDGEGRYGKHLIWRERCKTKYVLIHRRCNASNQVESLRNKMCPCRC